MTKQVAKRARRKRTCAWCREKFSPLGRGRPPRYCSDSCRQRAYEKRRAQRPSIGGALKALKRDLAQSQMDAHIREVVVQVLEDCGLIKKRHRAGKLRLVKKPRGTGKAT